MLDTDLQDNFSKNIQRLLKERNMTYKEFAEKLDYKPSTISMWVKGINAPRMDAIAKMCDFFNVTIDQLFLNPNLSLPVTTPTLFAEKPIQPISETINNQNELFIVNNYRKLNATGKKEAEKRISELTEIKKYTQKESASAPESKIIVLPYFRAGVSSGSGIFILGNEAEDEIELPDLPEYEAADFAIDVNGDSMEPDFLNGDIALVQSDAEMFPGDVGIFVIDSNAFIKELGENELISRNKDYKNIPIHDGDNVVCMGKVIGKVMY